MTTLRAHFPGGRARLETVDGTRLAVETLGRGPAVLLVHGFPHTRVIWRAAAPELVRRGFRVVALDMRGIGDSAPCADGFDVVTLAADLIGTLDAVGEERAHVVALDLGATPAVVAAAQHPDRVATLTVTEALIGDLPGAEAFLSRGVPWWFGFHQTPGALAEDLVTGHEDLYVEHFLAAGTRTPPDDDLRRVLVDAHTGRERLHAVFAQYREMPCTNAWLDRWAAGGGRLTMPVAALVGGVVGTAVARQLANVSSHLSVRELVDVGHIVPLDAPEALARAVADHAAAS